VRAPSPSRKVNGGLKWPDKSTGQTMCRSVSLFILLHVTPAWRHRNMCNERTTLYVVVRYETSFQSAKLPRRRITRYAAATRFRPFAFAR